MCIRDSYYTPLQKCLPLSPVRHYFSQKFIKSPLVIRVYEVAHLVGRHVLYTFSGPFKEPPVQCDGAPVHLAHTPAGPHIPYGQLRHRKAILLKSGTDLLLSLIHISIGTDENYSARGSINIYGGTVESTESYQGINAVNGTSDFRVNIYGGTVHGRYAVNLGSNAKLTLSGAPTLTGTTAALRLYTAANTAANAAKVDATGYTGGLLTVSEDDPSSAVRCV